MGKARDHMAVYETEEEVAGLDPDMEALRRIDHFAVVATAPGRKVDFVSRFFAPRLGIPEDPVTGSTHCTLVPYWSRRLGRSRLQARQISRRGGDLFCEDRGDRVHISGRPSSSSRARSALDGSLPCRPADRGTRRPRRRPSRAGPALAASCTKKGALALGLALRRLPVAGSVLYVTAHPDDENNGVLVRSRAAGLRTRSSR